MQTITQLLSVRSVRHALSIALSIALAIPASLSSMPAHASGEAPGPIPALKVAERGAKSATVSWTAPWTDGGAPITDYRVEVRRTDGNWTAVDDGVSSSTRAIIAGLDAGVLYNVRVAAENANGRGPATVLGSLDNLMSNNNELCGSIGSAPLSCMTNAAAVRTVGYYSYPNHSSASLTRVSDVVELEGLCSLSKSVGVICSSRWNNRYGELGQGLVGGPIASFAVPIPTESTIVSIASDTMRNCALDSARQLWCWGAWHTSTRVSTNLLSPTVVKSGVVQFEGSCARLWDGTVECLDADNQWTSIPGLAPLAQLERASGTGWSSCGITSNREVVCFNTVTKAWSTRVEWHGAVDIVVDRFGARCALLETGVVKCAGPNLNGELGDGTRSSTGSSTAKLPEPVISIAANKRLSSAALTSYTCATGVSSTIYCWGEYSRPFSTGLRLSTVPLAVPGGGPATVTPYAAPSEVGAFEQVARGTNSVTVVWGAARSDDSAVVSHLVRWSSDSGSTWTTTETGRETRWESPQVSVNSTVSIQVAAVSEAGTGAWSPTFDAFTTRPPEAPADLTLSTVSGRVVTVRWSEGYDGEDPITRFDVEYSFDGTTWEVASVPGDQTSLVLNDVPARSAMDVRVRAFNAAGASGWSEKVMLTTVGTAPQTIFVSNNSGNPVFGGQVTWVMAAGTMRSALNYGLTDVGMVTFPIAPAGRAIVTMTGVQMPSGASASGSRNVVFSSQRYPFIVLPLEPSKVVHTVKVLLPDGQPVFGANVWVESLADSASIDGIDFVTPEPVLFATTNELGEATLVGYSTRDTNVFVEFNDGVLIQSVTTKLGLGDAVVSLTEMPWVDPLIDTTTVNNGTLVTIPVASSRPGTIVTAIAPAGAAQSCAGRILSARTNAAGRATLKVCATATGTYRVASVGAVSTSAVKVNVRGTRSTEVLFASATSPSHLTARITWSAPAFTGGNPITSYTVKITNARGVAVTRTVTTRTITFSGLTGASVHVVKITPNTRLGAGKPVTLPVPVS